MSRVDVKSREELFLLFSLTHISGNVKCLAHIDQIKVLWPVNKDRTCTLQSTGISITLFLTKEEGRKERTRYFNLEGEEGRDPWTDHTPPPHRLYSSSFTSLIENIDYWSHRWDVHPFPESSWEAQSFGVSRPNLRDHIEAAFILIINHERDNGHREGVNRVLGLRLRTVIHRVS